MKWQRDLEFANRKQRFETELPTKLDKAEADWHAAQPAAPESTVIHQPIDDTLQTGDSRLLGGAMEIKSPWSS